MRRQVLLALAWYHPKTHKGIARFAKENNWHLASEMVFDQRLPWHWRGDGILASLVAGKGFEDFIRESALPAVVIGNSRHGLDCPMVREDNEKIGLMAANYFLERGFHNFAFFWTNPHWRSNSFVARIERENYHCHMLIPTADNAASSFNEWLQKQLSALPKPLAIFCPDDNSAAELIEIATDNGFQIPEEIAILGVHNDELICENLSVTLSSIDNDFERQGYEAAALLQRKMDGENVANEELLIPPAKVVERISTDVLAYDNVDLVKALRFIKNNYKKPIEVEDVVNSTKISRRNLYNLFNKYLKRNIAEEIQRHRLEEAMQLMPNDAMTFKAISQECGFSNYKVFHRNFRQTFGLSPSDWRQENSF